MAVDPDRHLNLWKKRLGSVPEEIWLRTELETLVLADNDLTEIAAGIGRLKKLRIVSRRCPMRFAK